MIATFTHGLDERLRTLDLVAERLPESLTTVGAACTAD
jgi:hypothetical protein